MMEWGELVKNIANLAIRGANPCSVVSGLTCDVKKCRPGFLYAALTSETVDSERYGEILDGREFVLDAIHNGATVILTDEEGWQRYSEVTDITYLIHPNPNEAFAKLAANFFVVQPQAMVCVTGTNGKTSTVNFCRQLWQLCGEKGASIGNLGTLAGDGELLWSPTEPFSVPETVELHSMLSLLVKQGVDYVAMEATSHALFEYRLSGVAVSVAAFTSFSRDHLDFHITMEAYLKVKMRLFLEVLAESGTAVLCADMPEFAQIEACCLERGLKVISYGYQGKDIQLLQLNETLSNQEMVVLADKQQYKIQIPFPGEYQALNILCAVGILSAQGFSVASIVSQIPKLTSIPGRMQEVAVYQGGRIFLDYAHTDGALRVMLEDVKKLTLGRILLVFGAAGNRDAGKRELMGRVAAEYADFVVVTDDDPRQEDPAVIRQAIIAGCSQAYNIADRREAILFALQSIQKDDVLIIAGKGGDELQVIGNQSIPYSDYDAILAAMASLVSYT
jgi:UDP-N-acetylmuramyl-tripeptide synthetase